MEEAFYPIECAGKHEGTVASVGFGSEFAADDQVRGRVIFCWIRRSNLAQDVRTM